MSTQKAAGTAVFEGEPLLRIICTALVRLSVRRGPPPGVYDDVVQTAYNHLVLLCLRRGVSPPGSVPAMTRWAIERPLREWPLDVPADLETADARLVDAQTGAPTQRCFEWAVSAPDAAAELFENQVMEQAIAECRAARAPQSYTAFRRLLITRPVLTGTELAALGEDLDLNLLHEVAKRCYEQAPGAYQRDGALAECARCRCLLVPVNGGYRCELDRCRRDGKPQVGRMLSATRSGGVHQLRRPLRMFITGPGLAETDLEQELTAMGLEPQMWPNFDAYDLRVPMPSGQVWAVDVKDRANPALLGRGTTPLRSDPPYQRAFLVVPQYRFDELEAYQRLFSNHLPQEVAGTVELLSDEDFTELVSKTLGRRRRPARRKGRQHA